MDKDDLELFTRSVQHATSNFSGAALNDALEELGWDEALAQDRHAAVSTLFDLQGRANATSSALGLVVGDGLGSHGAVILPSLGGTRAPGTFDGNKISVKGIATRTMVGSPTVVVVATTGDTHACITVETDELSIHPILGLDPSIDLVAVTGQVSGTVGGTDLTTVDWSLAVRRAQIAISHELIGASRSMLDMARLHALERVQFGVPIASFQAVRHRLAETLVAIETAQSMVGEAWEDEEPLTTVMAKALAGKAARTTARHSQQVLAGIGFTLEHRFHLYFRRILVLDELFGSSRMLTKSLGEHLIGTRQLPPVRAL
jgi:hypothetical protein